MNEDHREQLIQELAEMRQRKDSRIEITERKRTEEGEKNHEA